VLGALIHEVVACQAAIESRDEASRRADSRELACGGVLEGREGHILLEALSEILGTFSTNIVACEPASKGRRVVSTRADGREMGMGGVLQGREGLVLLETL
jgi:hypothetical protein